MHVLNFMNRGIAVCPVVVHSEVVRRIAGDFAHEICNPGMACAIACTGRADELVALVSKRQNLAVPGICGLLSRDPIALGLVEEMDDAILRLFDSCPVIARELSGIVNHRTEWCAAFELRRCPGVPVTDGLYWAVEVDMIQLAGTIVGVGIIPEQASLAGHLLGTGVHSGLTRKRQPLYCKVELIRFRGT